MPGLQKSLLQHSYLTSPSDLAVSLIPTPPAPAPNELLISVRYIGIGFADLLVITGQYQNKPKLPFAGGTDWSGVVLEVGNGKGMEKWYKGQRVFGISILQNVASMPTIRGYRRAKLAT